MLITDKTKYLLAEIILLFIGTIVFCCLVSTFENTNVLLLLSGCLLTFHFFNKAASEENLVAIATLVCLFGSYLILCVTFRGWIPLLLLPYLAYHHLIKNQNNLVQVLVVIALPSILFIIFQIIEIIAIGGYKTANFSQSWLGLVFLLINSALASVVNHALERMSNETVNYRKAISTASINELSERFSKRELIIKQHVIERNIRLEERERISLRIHNAVGHTITNAIMAIEATEILFDIDRCKALEKLTIAKGCVRQGLDFVRQAVRMIDNDDEMIDGADIVAAFISHLGQFSTLSEITVIHNLHDYNYSLDRKISRIQGEFLVNSLFELLSNSRHSDATVYTVTFYLNQSHVRLIVSDNGSVFSRLSEVDKLGLLKKGFGLRKIEENALRLGGDFKLVFTSGFTVEITVPITNMGTRPKPNG